MHTAAHHEEEGCQVLVAEVAACEGGLSLAGHLDHPDAVPPMEAACMGLEHGLAALDLQHDAWKAGPGSLYY